MWDLTAMGRAGFTAVVSLECADPHLDSVARAGMRHLRLNEFVERELADGGRVLAHCYAGIGRTGTVLASRLVWQGLSVEEAVRTVRSQEPRAIQTAEQMEVLHHFVRYLAGNK
jgi:atypical dual specificity phosphatase